MKPGTIVDACVHRNGRSVPAHRSGVPKRSVNAPGSSYRRRCGSMVICTRSAIACTAAPVDSAARIRKSRAGAAAYGSGAASSTVKDRSITGTAPPPA